MPILSRKTPFILLLGDIVAFIAALWVSLWIRWTALPSADLFYGHLSIFSYLFVIWVVVYFIWGLYEGQAVLFQTAIPRKLLSAQLVNMAIAVAFFYFIPFIGIAPKTNLFIYMVVSVIFAFLWRTVLYRRLVPEKTAEAIMVGDSAEAEELVKEVNGNPHYHMHFSAAGPASLVVVDLYDEKAKARLPELYKLLFSKVRFMDMHALYESIFGRVALSLLTHAWFLENISAYPKHVYDVLKRIMDFVIALVLAVVSLVIYPFVYIAIKLDDGGPAFIVQERIGKDGKIIKLLKFRSMRSSDKGVWLTEGDDRITRVGKFLRKSRIDELPQLFSVIKGDMSLVGPRPDIQALGIELAAKIPYYNLRNLIKPGLSGWAQIRQSVVPQSLEETTERLAYDFYYIKHRSLTLDLKIALQTVATLAGRVGK